MQSPHGETPAPQRLCLVRLASVTPLHRCRALFPGFAGKESSALTELVNQIGFPHRLYQLGQLAPLRDRCRRITTTRECILIALRRARRWLAVHPARPPVGIAGNWLGAPLRVLAPHLGACCMYNSMWLTLSNFCPREASRVKFVRPAFTDRARGGE